MKVKKVTDDIRDQAIRFGKEIKSRREELGLTREEASYRGGPSPATMYTIENGRQFVQPRPVTFRKLDSVLSWKAGSSLAAWNNQHMDQSNSSDQATVEVAFTASLVDQLRRISKEYESIADQLNSPELNAVNHKLDRMVDRLMRKWIIGQAEARSIRPGLSSDRSYAALVRDYLDGTHDVRGLDDEDRADLEYLRWLNGDSTPSEDVLALFNRRWADRTAG